MPNRYIREAAIRSKGVNQLSWQAEVFWRRLLNVVDDFGRHHADPELLRADVFPRQLEKVRVADIERLIAECEKAVLLFRYEVDSKPFLVLNQWEQGRAKKSRYPDPPSNIGKHLQTHSYEGLQMSPSPTQTQTPSPTPAPTPSPIERQPSQSAGNGNGAAPVDLTKLTKSACERVGTEIVDNHRGWSYDNCKVKPEHFVRKSIVTELLKWVGLVSEAQVHAAWQEAVTRTHKAVVDELTQKPLSSVAGYCIVCFREALATEGGKKA